MEDKMINKIKKLLKAIKIKNFKAVIKYIKNRSYDINKDKNKTKNLQKK